MAKATAVTAVTKVTLELSVDEARALLAMAWHVGGTPGAERPRSAMERIFAALQDIGIDHSGIEVKGNTYLENK